MRAAAMDMTSAWANLAEQFVDDMDSEADPALRSVPHSPYPPAPSIPGGLLIVGYACCARDAAATGDVAELAMCMWRPETGARTVHLLPATLAGLALVGHPSVLPVNWLLAWLF